MWRIASSSWDNTVHLWRLGQAEPKDAGSLEASPSGIAFHPNSRLLATGAPGTPSGANSASPTPGANVDRTGVTPNTIVIGLHAPVTGAAPFPTTSFQEGKDLYFRYINDKGGINGRKVQVVFQDDQYDPSHAQQVCKQMVEQNRVFLLVSWPARQCRVTSSTASSMHATSLGSRRVTTVAALPSGAGERRTQRRSGDGIGRLG